MSEIPLPDYESPPVVETILGVQFDPLEKLTAPLLGAFWCTIRNEWPNASEAPYLESKFEQFGADRPWSRLRLQLKQGHPPIRLQLRNEASDRMIQVQNSRLHVNWMGYEGADYPRYPAVRSRFENAWERFTRFVETENLGQISPNQWEVTYLNHIPIGSVWNTPKDWSFLRFVGDTSVVDDVAQFERFQGGWRFALPENSGRLHVSWKTASRRKSEDSDEELDVVVLEQTARGPLSKDADAAAIIERLDAGRSAIVRSFSRLMSKEANAYWGYQS
ncbi:MAG: TIGR04255 family protein [Planctomycetaceae bacterium]